MTQMWRTDGKSGSNVYYEVKGSGGEWNPEESGEKHGKDLIVGDTWVWGWQRSKDDTWHLGLCLWVDGGAILWLNGDAGKELVREIAGFEWIVGLV